MTTNKSLHLTINSWQRRRLKKKHTTHTHKMKTIRCPSGVLKKCSTEKIIAYWTRHIIVIIIIIIGMCHAHSASEKSRWALVVTSTGMGMGYDDLVAVSERRWSHKRARSAIRLLCISVNYSQIIAAVAPTGRGNAWNHLALTAIVPGIFHLEMESN